MISVMDPSNQFQPNPQLGQTQNSQPSQQVVQTEVQAPQTQPTSENLDSQQFDFIMNPQTPPKKSLLPNNPKLKMLIIGLGVVTLVVLLLVVIFSIFGSKDSSKESLVKIAQQQNEIIRIAGAGTTKAGGEKAKKLAVVTSMTMKSDQNSLINYLAKQKRKVKDKELVLLTDKKTDQELTAASSNGRYDEVFTQIITEKLAEYQKSLEAQYGSVGPKGKEVIKQSNDNVTLILKDNTRASQ